MIQLHPLPDVNFTCPYCNTIMDAKGWSIPGMRNLAELECPICTREYYGDLPAGHGLYYPMLLEKRSGNVHDRIGIAWFSNWLRDSYQNRVDQPVKLDIERFRKPLNPVLVNCLDVLYGHSLLKLLGVNYYLAKRPEYDVIVLVPIALRWLVPDGVAEIWTLDASLSTVWNEWLAKRIHELIDTFPSCKLGLGLAHPHPEDFDIEKFTRVKPFPVSEWEQGILEPKITYIWREDRFWLPAQSARKFLSFAADVHRQVDAVIELFNNIKNDFTHLDFCVVGLGKTGKFPEYIKDLRHETTNHGVELEWCKQYSQSMCVIGIHGSNMLLPSALAGSVIELVPDDRWGNLVQDILPQTSDVRDALFRYQFLPAVTSPTIVAGVCKYILKSYADAMLYFQYPWVSHDAVTENPLAVKERYREIKEKMNGVM